MERALILIDTRNGDRRRIEQHTALNRRAGERRREMLDDAMRELRASSARHARIQAAIRARVDAEVTDFQARYYAACAAQGHRGVLR